MLKSGLMEKLGSIDLESVAALLLEKRFILTALEFHTELIELGRELPILRDYFSNPSNFELYSKTLPDSQVTSNLNRSSSQTTLDSLDWARCSEDGERFVDDKIVMLEFELRKAKETILGLRENLTQAAAITDDDPTGWRNVKDRCEGGDSSSYDLRPHEVRTLNFLINEYLVMRNYKMTTITFADENDNQDFENWDDVGLNIPRPPKLTSWLKEKVPQLSTGISVECQTSPEEESHHELDKLKAEVDELRSLCAKQELALKEAESKMSTPYLTPIANRRKSSNEEASYYNAVQGYKNEHSDTLEASEFFQSFCEDEVIRTASYQYLEDHVASIEDSIEKSSKNVDILNVFSEGSIQEDSTNDEVEPENGNEKDIVVHSSDSHLVNEYTEETDEISEILPEGNDIIDPRKCHRLPPLGASSESSCQGLVSKDYICAQRGEAKRLLRNSSCREPPLELEGQILDACFGQLVIDSKLQNQIALLSVGCCDLLNLVSESLLNVAPNVILAKREELLPLLVYAISNHDDMKMRERLLHLLFNLTKKPDKEQRATILLGLVSLARIVGSDRLESELLPQSWEQLSHKHHERRLLVAQSVAVLAPYVSSNLRNSLLLSMLLQLLAPGGEKDDNVREAALGSLSLLIMYLSDQDKFISLIELLLQCLENSQNHLTSNKLVHNSNIFYAYSSLACWAVGMDRFYLLLSAHLDRILSISQEINQDNVVKSGKLTQLCDSLSCLYKGLLMSCPYLVLYLFKSIPLDIKDLIKEESPAYSQSIPKESPAYSQSIASLINDLNIIAEEADSTLLAVHSALSSKDLSDLCHTWKELDLIVGIILPKLVNSLLYIEVSCKTVLIEIINFFSKLLCCLGPQCTYEVVRPLFIEIFEGRINQIECLNAISMKAPLVVYIVGLMGCPDFKTKSEVLKEFLSEKITSFAINKIPLDALILSVSLLLESHHSQDVVLATLWGCIVHEKACVRKSTARFWELLCEHVQKEELATRVVPALVTLAADAEEDVRAAVVPCLVKVLVGSASKEMSDKVMLQLESVCEETQVLESSSLKIAIAKCCSNHGFNLPQNLLHQLFLPCLCRAALGAKDSPEDKLKFGCALLEAFSALTSSSMPDHIVAHFILPPLNELQKTLGAMSNEHMETITTLTKEFTLRAQPTCSAERMRGSLSTPSLISLSSSLSSSVGAMGAGLPIGSGVEDVKNRMSKMFANRSASLQGKTPTLNITTLFKKK